MSFIVNPPIVPPVAVIVPVVTTEPSCFKWNPDELISTFPKAREIPTAKEFFLGKEEDEDN